MATTRRTILGSTLAAGVLALGAQTADAAAWPVIGPGSNPLDIKAIQLLINNGGISTPVDGVFSGTTYLAVKAYQRKVGLAQTGRVDSKTLPSLVGGTISAPASGNGVSNYRVRAARYLMIKHGYGLSTGNSTTPSTVFDAQMGKDLASIRIAAGESISNNLDTVAWMTLLSPVVRASVYYASQRTSTPRGTNCGPASAVAILLNQGVRPGTWVDTASAGNAVTYFRYTSCGIPKTAARDLKGTECPDLAVGFGKYGFGARVGSVADVMTRARAGLPSICGGNSAVLKATNNTGTFSHWIAVLGFSARTGKFIVSDPLNTSYRVQLVTQATLQQYNSTNPGYYPGHPTMQPPSRNNVLIDRL